MNTPWLLNIYYRAPLRSLQLFSLFVTSVWKSYYLTECYVVFRNINTKRNNLFLGKAATLSWRSSTYHPMTYLWQYDILWLYLSYHMPRNSVTETVTFIHNIWATMHCPPGSKLVSSCGQSVDRVRGFSMFYFLAGFSHAGCLWVLYFLH